MDPISASESGKNAYYLGSCRFAEHNPPYAACLNKIKRVRAGEKGVPSYCAEPIKNGTCQATVMRQNEELAGQALYFIPREDWQAGLVKAPPWATPAPASTSPVTKAAKPTKPAVDVTVGGTYADAINAAMKSSVAPVSPPTPSPSPSPAPAPVAVAQVDQPVRPPRLPGENPVQYARRCAAIKGATK